MKSELPKPLIQLGKKTILEHTVSRFLGIEGLKQVIVSTSSALVGNVEEILAPCIGDEISWKCVEGGAERQHSIHNALKIVQEADLVLVHDAVRPFIKVEHINDCCEQAAKAGAAIIGIPAKDTIKKVDKNGFVTETPDRKTIWQVQTPQVFKTELLKEAYDKADSEGFLGTDDASLVEWLGKPVKVVRGDESNIKITYPRDLKLAEFLLREQSDSL